MGEYDSLQTSPTASDLTAVSLTTTSETTASEKAAKTVGPFTYDHLGSLAYIGGDKAIADFPFGVHISGFATHFFWRSAYLSTLFSLRNRVLVSFDWTKKTIFGRDISRE
ncbi:hypothetical protein BASA83_012613 [Batrachochytrium salamandrivorans]|nr:hypothetical protein BASA83_012613 [Batrachochytrium salamandrivorans]